MPQEGKSMRDFINEIAARRDSEDGQAMVEYGLILALVSVVAIGILATVGTDVKAVFQSIADSLGAAL
jgi:pilus assembly protein Flp/PilA